MKGVKLSERTESFTVGPSVFLASRLEKLNQALQK